MPRLLPILEPRSYTKSRAGEIQTQAYIIQSKGHAALVKAKQEAYNIQSKSRATGIQYIQSTHKQRDVHTILSRTEPQSRTERLRTERSVLQSSRQTGDGGRRAGADGRRLQVRPVDGEGRAGTDVQELQVRTDRSSRGLAGDVGGR